MPITVTMPALSPTMEEGTLAKWLKSEGEEIFAGDVIAEIETDKATMEIEAVNDGILAKIIVPAGTERVAVNSIIAEIIENDDSSESAKLSENNIEILSEITQEISTDNNLQDINQKTDQSNEFNESNLGEHFTSEFQRITVRESLRDAIAEEMRRDEKVFLLGEEVGEYQGAYKITQGLLDEFGPNRIIDTPITEHGFTGLAVGAAFRGLKPIVEFMTFNFAMQAIDHIINSAAKTLYMSGGKVSVPIVFRGPNGAASRVAAQHSQNFASWYSQIPGLKVVCPYSASDAKGLLKSSILDPNPVVFLENEILYGQSFDVPVSEDHRVPIGKAKILKEGKDVTIISYSITVRDSLKAASFLEEHENISAEVIDLRTLRPLDIELIINSVKKTNRLIIAEEGWSVCSISSEISALVVEHAFDYLDAPILRVTGEDVPMPYAANLEALALPSAEKIISAAKNVCYR